MTSSARTAIAEQIVVDASVLVEYLAPGELESAVRPLFGSEADLEYWLPDAAVLEVANALRKWRLRHPRFTDEHLAEAISGLLGMEPLLVSARDLIGGAVSHLGALTAYDAAYLALAEGLRRPLVTFDRALQRAAGRTDVQVLRPGTRAFEAWLRSR